MTTAEIASMVESIGLLFCYYQFETDPDNPAPDPPFVCFYYPGEDDFQADNINYAHITELVIELYTDEKDFSLENRISDILTEHELSYSAVQDYIDSERMFMTTYTMEVCINADDSQD